MVEPCLLRIEWEGPLSFEMVRTKTGPKDRGLYQVYIRHFVFGPDSLVYIGKAVDQTFSERFEQHWKNWLQWESDISIRLGRLADGYYRTDDNMQEWNKLVANAEKLTVYWHTPPYNCHFITGYDGPPLRIQNWVNRGSLLPEYSDPTQWQKVTIRRPDQVL